MRLSGPSLTQALIEGLIASGVDVVDIGEVGTEEVYFATFSLALDGGIMVTASHNPADYNGMKFVAKDAVPISGDTGLMDIRDTIARVLRGEATLLDAPTRGTVEEVDVLPAYIEHLLTYVDAPSLSPLKIVANACDGMAGPVIQRLRTSLPFELIVLNGVPDGTPFNTI